ncbi:MAG: M48 family metallopeptidase [Pseudomonadota bacterium]|nr:M48 family metallopeptidase [Pseudomonadota bacterium]
MAQPQALIRARWFDGRSSQARAVLVRFAPALGGQRGPDLWLHALSDADGTAGAEPLRIAFKDVVWPEAWSARRVQRTVLVDMNAHGSLEVDDATLWHTAFAAYGGRASLAQRMQTHWQVLAAVCVVAVAALVLFYRDGTPWAATQLTRHVPLEWETDLATRALQALDAGHLKPSALSPERQAALRRGFDDLAQKITPGLKRYSGYAPRLTLAFRSGMGANALALPGGTVVMTDSLVERAGAKGLGDEALLGVLAHEIGHVLHRHTTRMVVEQGVLNIGLGLALGDASGIMSTGGALLTGLAYRRQHESEADCFSIALMRQASLPTAPMADLLSAISHDHPDEDADPATDKTGKTGKTGQPPERASGWTTLLSSHPDTGERVNRLKQAQAGGC